MALRLSLGKMRLGEIEKYVLRHTLYGVTAALTVISSMIILINFVELSRTVGGRAKDVTAVDILGLTLLQSPALILILLPFVFLFGVLGAYTNLNRRSELIAMRAAGVSAWRFILPSAAAAAAIGVVTVMALNPIASALNDRFVALRDSLWQEPQAGADKPIWLRQGDGRSQIIIRAKRREPGPGVRLGDVSLWQAAVRANGSLQLKRRFDAKTAELHSGRWILDGARAAEPGAVSETYSSLSLPSTLNERTALDKFAAPSSVPFWALPGVIAKTEKAGFSATSYRLKFQQLLATPLMFAGMAVLAAAFSLRLVRLGGLARLAASAVGLGFVIFFLNQLCNSLGRADVLPPFFAAWTPPLLALLSGLTLLCYTEDG